MQLAIATEPIREIRGDDWTWAVRLRGADEAPVDLSDCGFDGAVIKWLGGSLPLTLANGRLEVDAPNGIITVKVARGDTAGVPPGQGTRLVLPVVDALNRKSTLVIIRIAIREP